MTHESRSLATRVLVPACLIVFSLVLALGLVEAALRLFYPMSDFLWQWDSRIGMKLIPGKQGRSVKPGFFDVAVSVNGDGFRDRGHAVDKDPGTLRVLLLGDSFVEAIQVPFEDSITAVLQERLSRYHRKVETLNFGVSGSGTARQYLALREYGLRYQPDLVLLFFVGNDVRDNSRLLKGAPYFPYPRLSEDGRLLRDSAGEPLFTPFTAPTARVALPDVVKHNWKTYRFIQELADQLTGGDARTAAPGSFGYYELYRLSPLPAWAEAWSTTQQMILATRDLAQANKAKFGVVFIPSPWELYPEQWLDILNRFPGTAKDVVDPEYPSRRLESFLKAYGVTVFNLLSEFRRQASERHRPLYIPRDDHWTTEGHRLAADLLAEPSARMLGIMRAPGATNASYRE